jgi:arsenite methyltransferase
MDNSQSLRLGVHQAYSAVAHEPAREHPFAVGRQFAEGIGYPAALLEGLPAVSVEAFTGVSSVSLFAELPAGARVLDLGCGAGVDALIAGQRVGPSGAVVGLDFSIDMLARARQGAREAGLDQVEFCQGDAEHLPFDGASIEVAMVNGIFNLNPARTAIFNELARVVKPGGRLYAAELILREPMPPGHSPSLDDWFS